MDTNILGLLYLPLRVITLFHFINSKAIYVLYVWNNLFYLQQQYLHLFVTTILSKHKFKPQN